MAVLLLLIYAQLDGKMGRNGLNNITIMLSLCCICGGVK